MPDTETNRMQFAYLIMVVAPLLFSSNLIFGRGVIGERLMAFHVAGIALVMSGVVLATSPWTG